MINENKTFFEIIETDEVAKDDTFGSNGIKIGNLMFLSNQLPIDPFDHQVHSNIEIQTNQVIQNLVALLAVKDLQLSHIVKLTVYLTDLNELARVQKVFYNYFEQPFPAITTIEVQKLPSASKISVDAIAIDTTYLEKLATSKTNQCNHCYNCHKGDDNHEYR